jgi:hypothetical protein
VCFRLGLGLHVDAHTLIVVIGAVGAGQFGKPTPLGLPVLMKFTKKGCITLDTS